MYHDVHCTFYFLGNFLQPAHCFGMRVSANVSVSCVYIFKCACLGTSNCTHTDILACGCAETHLNSHVHYFTSLRQPYSPGKMTSQKTSQICTYTTHARHTHRFTTSAGPHIKPDTHTYTHVYTTMHTRSIYNNHPLHKDTLHMQCACACVCAVVCNTLYMQPCTHEIIITTSVTLYTQWTCACAGASACSTYYSTLYIQQNTNEKCTTTLATQRHNVHTPQPDQNLHISSTTVKFRLDLAILQLCQYVHAVVHCNTLQHTPTHANIHCDTLYHSTRLERPTSRHCG